MDELMNRQNTIKEIKATIIIAILWIAGMLIFGFVHYDLMYLIINAALFILTIFVFVYYIKKYRKTKKGDKKRLFSKNFSLQKQKKCVFF